MDENKDLNLQQQVQEVKEQLNVLKNLLNNLYIEDDLGTKRLRPNVKEKDIEMLSEAIVKIKTNYKDIVQEMKIMKEREEKLTANHSKTRSDFMEFAKEFGVKIPTMFKDFYQIDG